MPPNTQTNAVVIERLDRIQADICTLQGQITKQDEDRHEFRELYIAEQVNARRDIDAAHVAIRENKAAADKRIETVEAKTETNTTNITKLDSAVTKLTWAYAIFLFITMALGGALLSGKAYLVFR